MKIAAAGSCFAQHIGQALKRAGCPFVDMEPPPAGLAPKHWQNFGYDMYSARYGNVYTSRQMLQLLKRATKEFQPQVSWWSHRGGYVDPFRPTIEPLPFESIDELDSNRRAHLERVVAAFETADLFVFTLGLTESWCARTDGATFPLAPGIAGGIYDPAEHCFSDLALRDVVADLEEFFARARAINSKLHFILTVSPVPLAATATHDNVIVASSYSKAVLRAACGEVISRHSYVDYFPSYEIISSHLMGGMFYELDGRTVTRDGVDHVMRQFFAEHPVQAGPLVAEKTDERNRYEVFCEQELLAAAARLL